jgi:hypothetical protein
VIGGFGEGGLGGGGVGCTAGAGTTACDGLLFFFFFFFFLGRMHFRRLRLAS